MKMFNCRNGLILVLGALVVLVGAPPLRADNMTASPDGPEAVRIYFTEGEALVKVFGKDAQVAAEDWVPDEDQRERIESALGRRLTETGFVFHRGRQGERDLGWAIVLEEKGRFKPITFMVQVKQDGEVGMVLVMVYRESRGDGVKRQRFLKQFRDRDVDDTLRLNRNIVGVSGATLSSRALTAGVRKALVLGSVNSGGNP